MSNDTAGKIINAFGFRSDNPMSLRDYFAGQALAGILAGKASHVDMWNQEVAESTARQAYERADAMLYVREAKP